MGVVCQAWGGERRGFLPCGLVPGVSIRPPIKNSGEWAWVGETIKKKPAATTTKPPIMNFLRPMPPPPPAKLDCSNPFGFYMSRLIDAENSTACRQIRLILSYLQTPAFGGPRPVHQRIG